MVNPTELWIGQRLRCTCILCNGAEGTIVSINGGDFIVMNMGKDSSLVNIAVSVLEVAERAPGGDPDGI